MNIGENILKMRKEKGITQEQLADVLCISAGAVSKWETGASEPDISMLPRIANFFGVSIDRVFNFTLTESDTPENIIKRVRELTDRVGFDYDASVASGADIKIVMKCDEAISILTDACIKFPNNYELKAELCRYKHLDASKYIKEPENYKKALREVLGELYALIKLSTDRKVNDNCYNIISQIHLKLEEYDKAVEAAGKYGIENRHICGRDEAILQSLQVQGKTQEAEKYIQNAVYSALTKIFVNFQQYTNIAQDFEQVKRIHKSLLNLFKVFSDDSPGPFDLYMITSAQILAFAYLDSSDYAESVKYFEEMLNYVEKFKIFSENKEINSEFFKFVDKDIILYNPPFDHKKHLLTVFELFEKGGDPPQFAEMLKREDFQKFAEKLQK